MFHEIYQHYNIHPYIVMSQQKSQKSNWLIQAEHVTKTEEKSFLSMFGYVKKRYKDE